MRLLPLSLLGLHLIAGAFAIEPTEVRTWTSTSGSRTEAKAVELTRNGTVKLVTSDDREIVLDIAELIRNDQALLEKHFREDEKAKAPAPGTGVIKGPLKADADTTYYLYLPANLDRTLRSPAMIWTQSDGAKAETLERLTDAADLLGMIIATPVEARNEGAVTLLNNLTHTNHVID